jgi:hypothetical protein
MKNDDIRALRFTFFLYERTLNGMLRWSRVGKHRPDNALHKWLNSDAFKPATEETPEDGKRILYMPEHYEKFLAAVKGEDHSDNLPPWRRSQAKIEDVLEILRHIRKRRNSVMHGDPSAEKIDPDVLLDKLATLFVALESILATHVFDFPEGRALCLERAELAALADGETLFHKARITDGDGKSLRLLGAPRRQDRAPEEVDGLRWPKPPRGKRVWVTEAPLPEGMSEGTFQFRAQSALQALKGARRVAADDIGLSLWAPVDWKKDLLGLPAWRRQEKWPPHGYVILPD